MPWSIFTDGGGPGAAVTWADDLLKAIGAPRSAGNRQMVYDWEVSEGGGGRFNPLNQGPDPNHPNWSGGSQYGGGAADYTSWATGLKGARDYLGMSSYKPIRAALRNNDPGGAEQALFSSPWASSHYGGGANFSNVPLPGQKSALKGGAGNSGNISTTAASKCPSFLSDPIGWATCNAATNAANATGIGSFFLNPADALERIGLIIFGALMILVGIAILGFGPASRALGIAATTSRQTRAVGRAFSGDNNAGPPDPAIQEERTRRIELAERNVELGERKQQFREDRELRISRKQKHRGSSEPNPNPQHN